MQPITFHDTILDNKRDTQRGAYFLFNNFENNSGGFYPSKKFYEQDAQNGGFLAGTGFKNTDNFIYSGDTTETRVYKLYKNGEQKPKVIGSIPKKVIGAATVSWKEDKVITNEGKIYTVNNVTNTIKFDSEIGYTINYTIDGVTKDFEKEYKKWSNGNDVRRLQTVLNKGGFNSGNVDGVFGPITETALKAFQLDKDIAETGILDQATRDILNDKSSTGSTASDKGYVYFDGIFVWYFFQRKIWRQIYRDGKDMPIEEAFADFGEGVIKSVEEKRGRMFIYFEESENVRAIVWDKKDFERFQDRDNKRDERYLGSGVINNTVILVTAKENRRNFTERKTDIIISEWTGAGYKEIRTLRGPIDMNYTDRAHYSTSDMLLFAVNKKSTLNGDETCVDDLYNKSYVYRITYKRNKGLQISAIFETNENRNVVSLLTQNGFEGVLTQRKDIHKVQWYINADTLDCDDVYNEYGKSVFVSNFYGSKDDKHFSFHKLTLVFEKFIKDEELSIYYRTSDRDDWTFAEKIDINKLKNHTDHHMSQARVNSDKALSKQEIAVTIEDDGQPIDEYYEIQYKFVSENGASIIKGLFTKIKTSRNNDG